MFIDLVMPKDNEAEFIEMAGKLGIPGLCFLYHCTNRKEFEEHKALVDNLKATTKLKLFSGIVADAAALAAAKQLTKVVAVTSSSHDRDVIERGRPGILFGMELLEQRDALHQRNSGLNQVHCALMAQNRVMAAFPFAPLLSLESKRRALAMGRIMQNIRLCRKYRVVMLIASFAEQPFSLRSGHDLKSFYTTMGMHPREARDALERMHTSL